MLERKYRLRKKDIGRLFKKGTVARESFLLFRYGPNFASHPRFAVIIPKAVVKKATGRNRLRRKTHVELAALMSQFQEKRIDATLTFKAEPKDETEIGRTLEAIFRKTGLLK